MFSGCDAAELLCCLAPRGHPVRIAVGESSQLRLADCTRRRVVVMIWDRVVT